MISSSREGKWKSTCRSSTPEGILGKGVQKICSKLTGEHPCRNIISMKFPCNFIEIALWHGCSPVNLLYIFRTPFSKNISGWLLLIDSSKTFHIVDHLLLLKRLEMYFVNTTNLAWFSRLLIWQETVSKNYWMCGYIKLRY